MLYLFVIVYTYTKRFFVSISINIQTKSIFKQTLLASFLVFLASLLLRATWPFFFLYRAKSSFSLINIVSHYTFDLIFDEWTTQSHSRTSSTLHKTKFLDEKHLLTLFNKKISSIKSTKDELQFLFNSFFNSWVNNSSTKSLLVYSNGSIYKPLLSYHV